MIHLSLVFRAEHFNEFNQVVHLDVHDYVPHHRFVEQAAHAPEHEQAEHHAHVSEHQQGL